MAQLLVVACSSRGLFSEVEDGANASECGVLALAYRGSSFPVWDEKRALVAFGPGSRRLGWRL